MDVRPLQVGLGWRQPHYAAVLSERPALDFLEVHSENFLAPGGAARACLRRARELYPISLHGVGLALGSSTEPDPAHLERLAVLAREIEPALISEHLCWGRTAGWHSNDLLPLPLSTAALARFVRRIDALQTRLKRRILVENIAAYLRPGGDGLAEPQFLNELARRSGCGILLDLHNLHVNACNSGSDPAAYVSAIDPRQVGQYHLAGGEWAGGLLIDTHGAEVPGEVWALYRHALRRIGIRPTLIERDQTIPALGMLMTELAQARAEIRASEAEQGTKRDGRPAPAPGGCAGPSDGLSGAPAGERDAGCVALDRWQDHFADALRDPAATPAAIAGFKEPAAVIPARLAVYRGNVVATAQRALANAYPVMLQLLGEEFFTAMARRYWQEEPACGGILDDYGDGLASFVRGFAPCAEFPYLGDLARIEWAVHRALGAPDQPPWRLGDLLAPGIGALAGDAPARCLALHPAACLLRLDQPAAAIWRAHHVPIVEREAALGRALADPDRNVVVCRPRLAVSVWAAGADVVRFLSAIGQAGPPIPLGTALAACDPTEAPATLAWCARYGVLVSPAAPAAVS